MALSRRTIRCAAAAPASATTASALIVARPAMAANTAYVMAYFTESPQFQRADYGLHLAVSQDGLNWTPLNQNNPMATPSSGERGLRDPFQRAHLGADGLLGRFPRPVRDRVLVQQRRRHAHGQLHQRFRERQRTSSSATERQDATFRITS